MLRRWPLLLLAAATACGGGDCVLSGCVSVLRLSVPADVQQVRACVGEVCVEEAVDGVLEVPLSRRLETPDVDVLVQAVAADGTATTVRGAVPVTRTAPEAQDEDCPSECVNGTATVDLERGTLLVQGPAQQ